MEEELLDLVDINDEVIGQMYRNDFARLEAKDTRSRFKRAVEAFIQNDKGELWIPRRTLDKQIAPGGLDFSCAEHVGAGEIYLDAIIRGFNEELNIKIASNDLKFLGMMTPLDDEAPLLRAIYIYSSNKTPSYNPIDFTESAWYSLAAIIKKLENGEPAKPSLLPTLKKYLL